MLSKRLVSTTLRWHLSLRVELIAIVMAGIFVVGFTRSSNKVEAKSLGIEKALKRIMVEYTKTTFNTASIHIRDRGVISILLPITERGVRPIKDTIQYTS